MVIWLIGGENVSLFLWVVDRECGVERSTCTPPTVYIPKFYLSNFGSNISIWRYKGYRQTGGVLLSLQYRLVPSACNMTRTTRGERNFLSYHLINYPRTSQSEIPAEERDVRDESRPLGGFVPATVPELRTCYYPIREYDEKHSPRPT